MMKKIVLILAAIACFTAAQGQFVLGVQGGYYWQKNSNSYSDNSISSTHFVGGLQLGYKVTPQLYVGIAGGYLDAVQDTIIAQDSIHYENIGMMISVRDHNTRSSRTGWYVAPQLKYEFLRFGNMHFNLLLQGQLRLLGPVNFRENFYTNSYPNPDEYREADPKDDHYKFMTWSVSLRPTLVYEFSEHLSAELMLDLLSIGYVSETSTYDPEINGIDPTSDYRSFFYAGLNSFTDVLRWENSIIKLGFNWTF